MTSYADRFLSRRGDFQRIFDLKDERERSSELGDLFRQLVEEASSSDELAFEREFGKAVSDGCLKMAIHGAVGLETVPAHDGIVSDPTGVNPYRSISAIILVLTLVTIAGAIAGTTLLTIMLALILGMLGWGTASGAIAKLVGRWPFSLLAESVEQPSEHQIPEEHSSDERQKKINALLRDIEQVFRITDAALKSIRQAYGRDITAQPAQSYYRRTEIQFIQDLAEAAATSNAEHALLLSQNRITPLAAALGLRLIEASDETTGYFAVDGSGDGPYKTLRPAVLEGNNCLARGYARRG